MTEFPDWTRGTVLLGKSGDDYLALATDAAGQLYVLIVGVDGSEVTRVLRTDDEGQLIIVPRGDSGNYMSVDSDGYLTTVMKGDDPGNGLLTVAVDSSGQLVMVPRGQGGNYLDVDSDGYLTTVIKGDDDGSLRTVTLDDAGRLSAFVIDSIDAWGNLLTVGNAELAARLGSAVLFDQRGRVRLNEDFSEGGPRWVETLAGTGADGEIVPTTFVQGGYSYKLTGGSDGDQYAKISCTFGANTSGKMGISLAFATSGNLDSLNVKVTVWDGGYEYKFGMVYDHTNTDFESYNAGETTDKIGDAEANDASIYQWNQMKIVADIATYKYVRAMFNDSEYDVTSHGFYLGEWVGPPKVVIDISAYSRSGQNDAAYVDNILFTLAEPS